MIKSSLPPIEIPRQPFHDYFFDSISIYNDKLAMINSDTGCQFTYKQLRERAEFIANAIVNLGVGKGEIVMMIMDCSPDAFYIFLGISLAGAAVSTLSPRLHAAEMINQFKCANTRFLFVDPTGLEEVEKVFQIDPQEHRIICTGNREDARHYPILSDLKYSVQPNTKFPPINVEEDIVYLPFSSGIQGYRKGINTSHFVFNAKIVTAYNPQCYEHPGPGEYTVAMIPFFKQMGLETTLMSLLNGAIVVCFPSKETISVTGQLRCLEKYNVRMVSITPLKMSLMIREKPKQNFRITHLKTVVTGTAAVTPQLYDDFKEAFPSVEYIISTYGMTEVGMITRTRPSRKYSPSCGRLGSGISLKVCDLVTGKELGPKKKGLIYLHGHTTQSPYLNNERATMEVFHNGWRKTGDIGYYDADENIYIVDKNKEMIKVHGFQVIPAELETLLLTHPAVKEAAVVAINDVSAGERPVAFVVLKNDMIASAVDIMTFVNERVIRYKQLVRVHLAQTLPRSPCGTLLRRLLAEAADRNLYDIS